MASLGERLDLRDNALNAMRLGFAGLVVVSHARPVGGFGGDPHLGDAKLGAFSVWGFFAISGYLITGSRAAKPFINYLVARFARIFPAFWVALLVVAFVAAPITAAARGGGWSWHSAVNYVTANATLDIHQPTIGSTLNGTPIPIWDGPLWTLVHEFRCYLIVGALFLLPVVRRNPKPMLLAAFVASSVYGLLDRGGLSGPHHVLLTGPSTTLLPFFFAGAALWAYRDQVLASRWLALAAAAAVLASAATWTAMVLAPLPLAYLVLHAGYALPSWTHRINTPNDYSYGLYVCAWPVMQILYLAGVAHAGAAPFAAATLAATAPLAVASWWLVERPAQRLGKRLAARTQVKPAVCCPDGIVNVSPEAVVTELVNPAH